MKYTDEQLFHLMRMNCKRYESEKENLFQEYLKMDKFIQDGLKKNSNHSHFETEKEMKEAMENDHNAYNTFSFGNIN